MWGSSANGGLRYRISFDEAHDAASLRERTLELLAKAGLHAEPGLVEVYPHGSQVLRLPLGVGSSLSDERGSFLRDRDGKPIGGRLTRTGTFRRNVPEMVATWEKRVNERRTTIASIFGAAPVVSLPSPPAVRSRACPTHYKQVHGGGLSAWSRSSWRTKMDDLFANGAPAGGRFRAAGDVLFDLRINQGHTTAGTLEQFGAWLRRPHGSKDLSGPRRERVIRQMERDALRVIARLDSALAAGTMGTKRGSAPSKEWPYVLMPTI